MPDLTAANQLLFHLGKGQGFCIPKLYTFSIPHDSNGTLYTEDNLVSWKRNSAVHSRKPPKLTFFCPSQNKPYPESVGKAPGCVLQWKKHEEIWVLFQEQYITSYSHIYGEKKN